MAETTLNNTEKEVLRRIPIGKNIDLTSNGRCWWVESHHNRKVKGEIITARRRLTGYHADFISLFDKYIDNVLLNAEIDDLKELVEEVKKAQRDIRKWVGRLKNEA